jgi:purine-binding chemotaxis protein CheW
MSEQQLQTKEAGLAALAGKYMTFKISAEVYGLKILKVRELIGLMEITRVPGTDTCLRGVINLRGKVIPVVDLRLKFGLGATEPTDQTVIIVVQHTTNTIDLTMGVLVDEVLEVVDISGDRIETPPSVGTDLFGNDFLLGVGRVDKRVVFLLDIDRVLSPGERLAAANLAA